MTEALTELANGRTMAYATFGESTGKPVLYCHGAPSSRLEPLFIGEDVIAGQGLHLVAPDRPGIGNSSTEPIKGFSGWVEDAAALADHLGWDRFAVIGNSGGTGFACACAALLPDRVSALALVSSAWRMDSPEAKAGLKGMYGMVQLAAKRAPWVLKFMFKSMGTGSNDGGDDKMEKFLAPPDRICMKERGRAQAGKKIMAEALKQGPSRAVEEMRLYLQDWDFDTSKTRVPIHMFHGEQDVNAPVAMARAAAEKLPQAQLTVYPEEAHLSTLCNHFPEIAAALRS